MRDLPTRRVFSEDDFRRWIDGVATQIFGMKNEEFLRAYHDGKFAGIPVAAYIASVEPLLNQ
jgi:hypothetical protein